MAWEIRIDQPTLNGTVLASKTVVGKNEKITRELAGVERQNFLRLPDTYVFINIIRSETDLELTE